MQRIKDFIHEAKIAFWQTGMNSARSAAERRRCWYQMRDLVNSRSEQQVRRMEQGKRLCR